MIFQQVFSYFTNNKLLYENQYGFRKHHSTELAAMVPIDRNSGYMDTGKIPICIFLDSPKVFDNLDRSILLMNKSTMVLTRPLWNGFIHI